MTLRGLRVLAAGCAWLAMAGTASAVTCTIGAPAADFGSYDVFSATASTTATTLSVTCMLDAGDGGGNHNVAYAIAISTGASNSFVQRRMKNGANSLGYNLYSDTARTQVWGDGTGSSEPVTGTMRLNSGHSQLTNTHTVYGLLPPLQDAGVGAYSDDLLTTITY